MSPNLPAYLAERECSVPPCGCFTCLDEPEKGMQNPTQMYMILCPQCGNKRCPHATHHVHPCTGSNEPGQPGSRYT